VTSAPLRVLYVGSWSRSGSTLLDLILGQVPGFVSVGELRFLWERGLVERQLCGCGVPVPECPFWRDVLREAFGGVDAVDPGATLALLERVDGLARLPWLVAPWRPPALDSDLRAFREVLGRLYRAVRAVSGASVVVDSSKYAVYGQLLAGVPGFDLRVLHLVRDSRAVAYSWTRRTRMPEVPAGERYMPVLPAWRSAAFWALEDVALHLLLRSPLHYQVLRYDALTTRPRAALSAALQRIGIAADLEFLQDARLTLGPNHTVAGNPLRFRRGDTPIAPDVEWQTRLSPGDRRIVTAITWPLLIRHGFPLRPGR